MSPDQMPLTLAAVQQLIDRQLPRAQIAPDNPLFTYELRHIRQSQPDDVKRFCLLVVVGLSAVVVGGWTFNRQLLDFVLIANVITTIALDLRYTLLAINYFNHQHESGIWEDIQLTPLPENDMLMAYYAIIQLRSWRTMFVETALRAATCSIVMKWLLDSLWDGAFRPAVGLYDSMLILSIIVAALPLLALLMVESLWRMRLMTAIGLRIAAQFHHQTFSPLVALGAVLAFRLAQLAFALGGFLIVPLASLGLIVPPVLVVFSTAIFLVVRRLYKDFKEAILSQAIYFAFLPQ